MTATVYSFRRKEETEIQQRVVGEAFCVCCDHTWTATVQSGTVWLECPECRALKGHFKFPCIPAEQPVRECACGNQLFYLTPYGHLCPNCGVYQRYD